MLKLLISILGVALVVFLVVWYFGSKQTEPTTETTDTTVVDQTANLPMAFPFVTTDGQEGLFAYTDSNRDRARLVFADQEYNLQVAPSASGARFTSADGKVEFWEHQGSAHLEIDGVGYEIQTFPDPTKTAPNTIYFDNTDQVWKDDYGVCHTCTVENGFGADGQMIDMDATTTISSSTVGTSIVATGTAAMLRYNPIGTTWTYNGGTLAFTDGGYSMNFGCNTMNGSYTVSQTALKFSQPASTRMACSDDISQKEQAFGQVITKMDTFTETAAGATLSGDGETMLLTKAAN